MTRNQRIGKWGEQAAADYLLARGYEVLARNVRTPYGEIDLIVKKNDFPVFVEVKARTSKTFGPPEMAVTARKQQHMAACAEYYAQQNGMDHWQIDVIAVEQFEGRPKVTHFENALS